MFVRFACLFRIVNFYAKAGVWVCVCVRGPATPPAPPFRLPSEPSNHTHCNWTHTLERILFRFHFFLLYVLVAPAPFSSFCFILWRVRLSICIIFFFFLYILGSGDVDIKCKTEFHFRQECSERSCCYWECYNIVEACNILPRIRVGTLTQTRTHMYVQRTLPTASCMLLTISARVSHPSSVFFSLLANLVYWFCVPVWVWEELLRMCVREFPFLGWLIGITSSTFTYTFHLCKCSQFIFHKYFSKLQWATTTTIALLTFQFPILSIFAANFPSRFAPVRYPCEISALDLP